MGWCDAKDEIPLTCVLVARVQDGKIEYCREPLRDLIRENNRNAYIVNNATELGDLR